MGFVCEREVLRYWLKMELSESEQDVDEIKLKKGLYERLRSEQSGPTSIFEDNKIIWRYTELSEQQFRKLRIVKGPPDTDWRLIASDQRLETAAQHIRDAESPDEFGTSVEDKIPKVQDMVEHYQKGESMGHLILLKEGLQTPWIADGNHRAAAKMIHLLEGGDFQPQGVYLGYTI